jgi:hypothetical protein
LAFRYRNSLAIVRSLFVDTEAEVEAMSRTFCALGLTCVLLAGCERLILRSGDGQDATTAMFMLTQLADGQQVFSGSVEVTSRTLEKALRRLGLSATLEQKDNVVRVRSETKGGKKFSLVLTPAPAGTHVGIEWEDGQGGLQLFADLVLPHDPDKTGAQK